jgi:hypothetical protein
MEMEDVVAKWYRENKHHSVENGFNSTFSVAASTTKSTPTTPSFISV